MYHNRPHIIGLTGSIGMGKSTVAKMFMEHGIPVFDADLEVRKLQGPGGAALPAIEAQFPGVTGKQGLNRQALGAMVFGNPEALKALERIMHPIVEETRQQFLFDNWDAHAVVLDVPLLLEGKSHELCDLICVVSAPFWVQKKRVLKRPGMSEDRFLNVLAHQMPDREKRRRADVVIETGRGLLLTHKTVWKIARMCNRPGVTGIRNLVGGCRPTQKAQ